MTVQLILASASPRRKELLEQLHLKIGIQPVELDETPFPDESPLAYAQRIAAEKSALCASVFKPALPILAADTIVVIDNRILGKPKNYEDGFEMLTQLSGRTHLVYSAVSLRGKQHRRTLSVTEVTFRTIAKSEIAAYWQTKEPVDKAGGYAIQGLGSIFIESIKGSYSGVAGLPLFETAGLLAQEGIELLQ